jgi:hypothetical protein
MELRSKAKVLFLPLAVCMAFSFFFAETLIADDHDHDCIGEGCPICLGTETVNNFIKNLKMGGLAVFLVGCPMFLAQMPKKIAVFAIFLDSPIDLKVRFNS